MFFTNYLLAFELVSLVLLVGAVAGVVLGAGPARRARRQPRLEQRDGATLRPRPQSDADRERAAP